MTWELVSFEKLKLIANSKFFLSEAPSSTQTTSSTSASQTDVLAALISIRALMQQMQNMSLPFVSAAAANLANAILLLDVQINALSKMSSAVTFDKKFIAKNHLPKSLQHQQQQY